MRRRNPLGIIITGYGRSPYGFAGPSRVARRGRRGNPGYFYGLGAELPSLYRSDDLAPSTMEIEMKRAQELSKLAVEVESLSARPAEQVAATTMRSLDQQIAAERAAQAVVNERGEPLYPPTARTNAALLTGSPELAKAAIAEQVVYNEALAKAAAADLRPPSSDDPKLWMAYEAAMARRSGTLPPGESGTLPPSSDRGPMAETAPPAAQAAAASAGAAAAASASTPYVDTTVSTSTQQLPLAPVSSGAGGALLLGGAALALYLLMR